MIEYYHEGRANGYPRRRPPSIFDDLPFRITPEGFRAYNAEDYLRALSKIEEIELRRTYGSIKAAESELAHNSVTVLRGK